MGITTLVMVMGGLTEKVTLELSPKEGGAIWASGEECSRKRD